jgi:hypothetical protein
VSTATSGPRRGVAEQAPIGLAPRARLICIALSALGLATAAVGVVRSPSHMWANWLLVSFYVLTLGLGALCFVAIEYASGSTWSIAIRRVPEALIAVIPAAAVAVGIALVIEPQLYPWTSGHFGGTGESELTFKHWWLQWPFFLGRAGFYVLLWSLLGRAIIRQSRLQDRSGDAHRTIANRHLSAAALVLFGLTFSLASFDWIMSLEPGWFSTIFAIYNFSGLFLAALAAIIVVTIWLERRGVLMGSLTDSHIHDLGKLFFAMSTFWAYIWFSQYMLIWYADIPEETVYFVERTHGWWLGLFILNVVLNWGVPFVVLMPRNAKKDRRVLGTVAVMVLVGRWLDLYLMILPSVVGRVPRFGLFEIGLAAGALGLSALAITSALRAAPLVPIGDPHLSQSLSYHS